ncbi:MAG: YihY/virulence factor BrkB family protein [Deltaproteobacteria bacterium]|nr:YihY/virulence factor BrkB family protein [Deltaproteobacteria bacterium]
MHILIKQLKESFRDLKGTSRLAGENHLAIIAGSVAFFSLFSLIPILILSFISSHFFITHTTTLLQTPEELGHFLHSLIPSLGPQVIQGLVVVLKQNSIGDVFSVLVLIWSAYELFESLQFAFAKISSNGGERNRFWATLMSIFCFLIVVIGSTLFVIVSTTDVSILSFLFPRALAGVNAIILNSLSALIGLFSVLGSVTLIYKVMPTQKVKWLNALKGSLLFLSCFILGRFCYQGYAFYFQRANAGIYGPFFSFLLAVVWIYFLSRIFLFAAQYAIYLEEK